MPGQVTWLVLILAIVLPKSNRDLRVLLIFVPLVLVSLAWSLLEQITGMPSEPAVQYGMVLQSMAAGMAALWLTAGYFESFRGLFRLLLAFAAVVLVAGTGILSYSMEVSKEAALFLAAIAFMTLAVLTAIILTREVCKGKCRPMRFMLWLALWMLLGSIIPTFGFIIAGHLIMSTGQLGAQLSEVLLGIFVVGPMLGLALYFLNLPFMILGFVNPFFRERLCGCLGLKPAATTAMASNIDNIAE